MYDVAFHLSVLFTVLSHLIVSNARPSFTLFSNTKDKNVATSYSPSSTPSSPKTIRPLSSCNNINNTDSNQQNQGENPLSSTVNCNVANENFNPSNNNNNNNKKLSSSPLPLHLTSSISSNIYNLTFRQFQNNYLFVYLLAVAADWMQGPYIYALYSFYGFSNKDIAHLYIAGFASSAIFGTFIASIADKYGRRKSAMIYCISYSLSCLTKHSSNFNILLLGRILGGIAYSILFSAFESWMIYEHHSNSFEKSKLSITFAKAQFGNGIVAILSGQIAGYFALKFNDKVIPFDISIIILGILSITIMCTWKENYGDINQSVRGGFIEAYNTLLSDKKILLLGISQSCFEGALYTFTFVWTPALQTGSGQTGEIPHGTIFSTFMACTMIGSNLFTIITSSKMKISTEGLMKIVFIIGAVLFICATIWNNVWVTYMAFLLFELLCGVYFPGMATVRAPYIPEQSRSAILTFFRVPLNLIVVFALYEDMAVKSVFALCGGLMVVGAFSMQWLIVIAREEGMDDGCGDEKKGGKGLSSHRKEGNGIDGKDENC